MDPADHLLKHARRMVESGQCRWTVRRYLECLHPSPDRDEALRRLEAAGGAATTDQKGDDDGTEGDDR